MKKIIVFILASIVSLPMMAQNETVQDEIVYVQKTKYIHKPKRFFSELYTDLGFNRLDKSNLFNGNEDISANAFPKLRNNKSKSFAIYYMAGRRFGNSGLSIVSGLGFDWVNYKFSGNMTIAERNDVAVMLPVEDLFPGYQSVRKSKLTASYINIPVLLKMQFRGFFISAGVTGGLNIGSHTKIRYTDHFGNNHKYKDHDIHLATFRYGFMARAGFEYWSIFATYTMSPLFAKNEGPQLYPFSMGISLRLY